MSDSADPHSPRAQRKARGWTSSAAGRCSSGRARCRAAGTAEGKDGGRGGVRRSCDEGAGAKVGGGGGRGDELTYFEQPEGRHPAGPALLVLGAQHLQLLAVAPGLAGLSKTQRLSTERTTLHHRHGNNHNTMKAGGEQSGV